MSTKRQYSDNDKATALASLDANAGNVQKTARIIGVPHKTLDDWSKGKHQHSDVAEIRTVKRGELAEKLTELAHLIVDAAPDKIDKAGLKDSLIAAGTAIDKAQLLRGQPTNISQTVSLTEANKTLADIRARHPELSESEARQIVAETFQVSEHELIG